MDEGTYWDRVQRIAHMMDPRCALASEAELRAAKEVVRAHEAGERVFETHILLAARKLKEAAYHPDTGEVVLLPLRLSFIVPCNLVLDTLMMSASGRLQVAAAQWLNQTYNALHYRANRNATHEESTAVLAAAYVGATASSVTAALAVERWAARAPPTSRWAPVLRRLGPLAAVAAADVLNVSLMRQSEFVQGVAVRTKEGEVVGHSRVAGAAGVAACIFGRVAAAAPVLSLPPLLLYGLEARSPWLRARPAAATAALMVGIATSIQMFVPLTFGIFRQTASLPSGWLEPAIAAAAPGQELFFNKGL